MLTDNYLIPFFNRTSHLYGAFLPKVITFPKLAYLKKSQEPPSKKQCFYLILIVGLGKIKANLLEKPIKLI